MKRTARSESVNIFDARSQTIEENPGNAAALSNFRYDGSRTTWKYKKKGRAGSMYVEPKISEMVIERSEKMTRFHDFALHLKDRGRLRYMLQSGEVEEARNLL